MPHVMRSELRVQISWAPSCEPVRLGRKVVVVMVVVSVVVAAVVGHQEIERAV